MIPVTHVFEWANIADKVRRNLFMEFAEVGAKKSCPVVERVDFRRMRTPCLKDGLKESSGERKNGSSPSVFAFKMPSSTWAFLTELFGIQSCRPLSKSHRRADGASCAASESVQKTAKNRRKVFFIMIPVVFID